MRNKVSLLLFVLLAGCATISTFDHYAYVQTTSCKVDALYLMALATENYNEHAQEVRAVSSQLDKLYEYEKNRPLNGITLQLWDKLRDTSGHLYGGFIQRWKKEKTLRPAFIRESQKQVGEAFNIIAQLESKKISPKQVPK